LLHLRTDEKSIALALKDIVNVLGDGHSIGVTFRHEFESGGEEIAVFHQGRVAYFPSKSQRREIRTTHADRAKLTDRQLISGSNLQTTQANVDDDRVDGCRTVVEVDDDVVKDVVSKVSAFIGSVRLAQN